jgi:WD40 repeat protein
MATTLSASVKGLEIVDRARRRKGWNKTVEAWQDFAKVSKSTLDRFWMRKSIKHENFIAICSAVGIDDWEQIIDLPPLEPTNIRRTSNLTPANRFLDDSKHSPEILELEDFAQQIFDWFGALDFTAEGLPRREGNYVEWIIQVPQRRARFDRVLIRAIIHETGLGDLDSLRRMVGQLRVDEGWLVTNRWVSQLVRQALIHNYDENLTCLTFNELIDQDANFTPYLEWLEREISKREIDRYYVDLGCTKGEFDADTRTLRGTSKYSVADGGIDRYIDRWLDNPVTEHVSILGEFGTGKTWFALHYAGKCLQAYQVAKSKGLPRPRLPLVIPLRDYAKALNVENVLAGFFYTQHNIRLNSDVFDRLNRMGKLLLIFDGFDEMADKIDTQKMTDNFWELAKVVTTNAKVILTCRTEHFPTAQDGRENMSGERIPSNANKIAIAPKFETLELMKFDDTQIREVLSRRTNAATVDLVMANSQLLDLLRRAVMAEFVLEALPEIEAGKPIDLARVYLYAVRHKMERDITTGRTFTSLADKLYFLCELAWEMLSEDKMSINYREFPDRLRVLFKDEVKGQKHLDHWHYDMMGQTMLIRNDDGDYSPAHRSLFEFFVAYKLAAELGLLADDFLEMAQSQSGIDESLTPEFYTWSEYWKREIQHQDDNKCVRKLIAPLAGFKSESPEKLRETFGKSPLSKVIIELLLPVLNLEIKYQESNFLLDLIKFTKATDIGYLGGNAATILVKFNSSALEHEDLSNTNLVYADLVNVGLRGTNLSKSNLKNCLTTQIFDEVMAIIFTHDDKRFITAHGDNNISIWDRVSGRELQKIVGDGYHSINCLALSIDGKLLYSGSDDKTIKEWDLSNGICQRIFQKYSSAFVTLAISVDGQFIYSASRDGKIKEWRLSNGKCQSTFDAHEDLVRKILLSRDGRFIYSASNDGMIKEWELSNGICQHTFDVGKDSVMDIALSSDGRFIYSASNDGMIKEWELSNGICQRTFDVGKYSAMNIALSSDGRFIYAASNDGMIKEWELSNGICQRTFCAGEDSFRVILLSRDGQSLYSAGADSIRAWNLADGKCQNTFKTHQNNAIKIALSGNGQLLCFDDDEGKINGWQLVNGDFQWTFEIYECWASAISLSRDGQFLYSGGYDGTIEKWELVDGSSQYTFNAHKNSVSAIAVSKNGQLLYSVSDQESIKEWNLSDGSFQRNFDTHEHLINAITLSYDEKSLYSASHRGIMIWKIADGSLHHTFETPKNLINAIALSSDEEFLYSGNDDGTVREWKLPEGICLRTFGRHEDSVNTIFLSEDGQFLYSCSNYDPTIKEWAVITGECLRTIDYRLCADANITNVKGLTPAQIDSLLALGAFSDDR